MVHVAQALHAMKEWEDFPIYVSCLMGNRHYIMEVCQDRANYEAKKRELEMEAERLREEQSDQQEALTGLVDKVNEQARIVEELQQQQLEMQRGSDTRIPLLQGGELVALDPYPGFQVTYIPQLVFSCMEELL